VQQAFTVGRIRAIIGKDSITPQFLFMFESMKIVDNNDAMNMNRSHEMACVALCYRSRFASHHFPVWKTDAIAIGFILILFA
jgi:hypothetical protein